MKLKLILSLLIFTAEIFAAPIGGDTLPYTFKAGDTARAASVNENFLYLLKSIRHSEAKIDTMMTTTAKLNDSISKLQVLKQIATKIDSLAKVTGTLNDSLNKLQNLKQIATKVDSLAKVTGILNDSISKLQSLKQIATKIDSLEKVTRVLNDSIISLQRFKQTEMKIENLTGIATGLSDSILKYKNNLQLPIGTIIGSMLPPDEFEKHFPGDASLWKLADGSASGNEYLAMTRNINLPDLRGRFLRGMNEGIESTLGDADGNNRLAGSYQTDAVVSHNHSNGGYDRLMSASGVSTISLSADDTKGEPSLKISGLIQPYGGLETRPRNVAVYWYVKVK